MDVWDSAKREQTTRQRDYYPLCVTFLWSVIHKMDECKVTWTRAVHRPYDNRILICSLSPVSLGKQQFSISKTSVNIKTNARRPSFGFDSLRRNVKNVFQPLSKFRIATSCANTTFENSKSCVSEKVYLCVSDVCLGAFFAVLCVPVCVCRSASLCEWCFSLCLCLCKGFVCIVAVPCVCGCPGACVSVRTCVCVCVPVLYVGL